MSPGTLRAIRDGLAVAGLLFAAYLFAIVAPRAGTVGFDAFTEPALALEQLAKARNTEEVEAAIDELRQLASRIVVSNDGDVLAQIASDRAL